jgi:NAD-dependent SIR2 family protein deacetylase
MSDLDYLQYATNNKDDVEKSDKCYCVYCLQSYPAATVTEYIDTTAVCPRCNIDAVIPDSVGFEITDAILRAWRRQGFE